MVETNGARVRRRGREASTLMDDIGRLRAMARVEQVDLRVPEEDTGLCGAIALPE